MKKFFSLLFQQGRNIWAEFDQNLRVWVTWLSLIDMESPHDLSLLVQWLWANRIFLNTTKAEIILFRTKKRLNVNNLNFRISGQNLDTIKQTKYFNICLDKILKWKFHTEQIKSKLSSVYSSCGFLAKLRYTLNMISQKRIFCNLWFRWDMVHKYGVKTRTQLLKKLKTLKQNCKNHVNQN